MPAILFAGSKSSSSVCIMKNSALSDSLTMMINLSLKDKNARETGDRKIKMPSPSQTPSAVAEKGGSVEPTEFEKSTVVVAAEDIRIGAFDYNDPRTHAPIPLRNLQRPLREPGHDLLSWTACYDDSCPIHLSDKNGSGYFPSPRSDGW